jgi:hypothetical protein
MSRRAAGVAVSGAAIAAAVVTALTGAPAELPEIALHSTVLFHLERTVAVLASFLVVLVTVSRAWGGELPAELSTQGVSYGNVSTVAGSALDDLADTTEALHDEVVRLRSRVEQLEAGT